MARNSKDFTFDALTQLKDAGAITASAAAQVSGSAKVLDVGASRYDARVIVDVAAIKTSATDESYRVRIQGSTTADFSAGNVELAALELGATAATGSSAADGVSRHEIAFTNEVNGTLYRYVRAYTLISGTSPSVNYTAFVVQAFV